MIQFIATQLLAVAAFLAVIVALGKMIDSWLVPYEKKTLKERTIAVWFHFGDSDPLIVVQTPLRVIAKVLDLIYGPAIFSWRAFGRSTLVSFLLLGASLSVTGIMMGVPFAFSTPPWETFEESFALIDKGIGSDAFQKEWAKKENQAGKELILKWVKNIKAYHTAQNRAFYNWMFFFFASLLNAIMDFGCLVVARLTLSDMIKARTVTTIASLALANGITFIFVYTIFLTLVAAAAMPMTWAIIFVIYWIFRNISWAVGVCFLVPGSVAALVFSPPWIQVAAVNAAMPGLIVVFLSVLALCCFPIRRGIHDAIVKLLDRATMHEKGVLGFITLVVGTVIAIISALAFWMVRAPLV